MSDRIRKTSGALLVDTEGRLLLQQRDELPGLLYSGMIGLFGGHREGDETPLACVCREVWEEIGCRLPDDAFKHLCTYHLTHADGSAGEVDLFIAEPIATESLVISEGRLLTVKRDELDQLRPRLTPSAAMAVDLWRANEKAGGGATAEPRRAK